MMTSNGEATAAPLPSITSPAAATCTRPSTTTTIVHHNAINISRPVYDLVAFDDCFVGRRRNDALDAATEVAPLVHRLKRRVGRCCGYGDDFDVNGDGGGDDGRRRRWPCSWRCAGSTLLGYLPVFEHLRGYRWRSWLANDLVAGISGGVVHVPQGLGFALLTGVAPVYGLYTSIFPGWIYYVFGTSRHLSFGTMALTSLMVGAVVNREAERRFPPVDVRSTTPTPNSTSSSFESSTVNETYDGYVNRSWDFGNGTSMAAAAAATMTDEEAAFRVGVAVSVTLVAGIFQLLMRLCRLGVVATYMSMPFVGGFMTGSALQIMISQLPFQLGVVIRRHSGVGEVPLTFYEICSAVPTANACAVVVSLLSVAALVGVKEGVNERFRSRMHVPIPAELIVVVVSTLVSHFAALDRRFELRVIGVIPTGFPAPSVPPILGGGGGDGWPSIGAYITHGIVVGVVAFAIAVSMAKLMASRHRYPIDVDQELLANGVINAVGPFFGCFAATQAPPRTLVHESAGCRTQMTGFVSTLLPLVVVVCAGPLFRSLPAAVLGSIVTCALIPLMKQVGLVYGRGFAHIFT